MARESCDLDKDEAEILKPASSSTPPSSSGVPAPASPPPALLLNPSDQISAGDLQIPEIVPPELTALVFPLSVKQEATQETPASNKLVNRCLICRKKVGLTGFRCRCGDLFCGSHRYSDAHDCSFDYKSAGREEIARANPLVRASKIIKI